MDQKLLDYVTKFPDIIHLVEYLIGCEGPESVLFVFDPFKTCY